MTARDSTPADDPDDYLERVERHFGLRRGGRLMLAPRDWQLVQEWQEAGIPVAVVMRGINRAFDQFDAAGPRSDRINSLSYCKQQVLEVWQEHRELASADAGAGEPGSTGEDAARHLRTVAERCRDADRQTRADDTSALQEAARALEDLAAAAEAGDLRTREIDTRAGDIENRLRKRLPELFAATRTDAPALPRFSPWAV